MKTILITDGEQRSALAVIRSLSVAGYRCVVSSVSGRSLAGASKHAARDVRTPDPGRDPEEFARAVAELVVEETIDLVIPITEEAVLSLLPARDSIPAPIPFPTLESFRDICDKQKVLEVASSLGIRTPRQAILGTPGDASRHGLEVPLVLKPRRSVYTAPDGTRRKVGVRWVRRPEELFDQVGAYPEAAYPVMAQEAIVGPGVGVFVLLHEDRVLARFAHRRIREKPPSGGVSVVRQAEPMDVGLLQQSVELLKAFDWSGVAMVEYKIDARTSEPVLMEVNGRFWGSLQLAIDSGVDFPRILAELSFGRSVEPVEHYDLVRSRWFWGDVDHLIAVWRDPAAGWGTRLASFSRLITAFGPGYRQEVLRWSDPRPFLRESRDWFAASIFGSPP